jgi:hypothetical protein
MAETERLVTRTERTNMNCLVRYLGLMFQLSRIQDLALWEAEMTEPARALTSSA